MTDTLTADPKATKFRAEIIGKLDERIALLTEMRDRCNGVEARARFLGKVAGVEAVKEKVQENLNRYNESAPLSLLLGRMSFFGFSLAERFTDEYKAKMSGISEANYIISEYRH